MILSLCLFHKCVSVMTATSMSFAAKSYAKGFDRMVALSTLIEERWLEPL